MCGIDFIIRKFLSVKSKEVSWNELKPMVISHLNDYFEKNDEPIQKEIKKTKGNNKQTMKLNKIIEVLDTKIRPAGKRWWWYKV